MHLLQIGFRWPRHLSRVSGRALWVPVVGSDMNVVARSWAYPLGNVTEQQQRAWIDAHAQDGAVLKKPVCALIMLKGICCV